MDKVPTFNVKGPGFKFAHWQWNSFKISKILFLNEDTLAIVKSEASQFLSANLLAT